MTYKSRFWQWIDHRVRLTLNDRRVLVGTFIAFDKHLNVVLSDTEEFRILKPKKSGDPEREIKRPMGLMIIRGNSVISISAERAPRSEIAKDLTNHDLGPSKFRNNDQEGPGQGFKNMHAPGQTEIKGLGVQKESDMKIE